MKRFTAILLTTIMLTAVVSPAGAVARSSPDVFVHDERLSLSPAPRIINDRTYVPLVPFFESIGADVNVVEPGKLINIHKEGLSVSFSLTEKNIKNTKTSKKRNLSMTTISGRVFVPLRDTAEFLGYMVTWDGPGYRAVVRPPVNEVTVLAYRDILPGRDIKESGSIDALSLEKFQEQLDYLKEHDYYTMSLSDLGDFTDGKKFYRKSVVITFDGAYSGIYKYAFPVLKKHGFKGAVFTETSAVARSSKYAAWDQLKSMSDSGLVEVESLTHNLYKFDGNAYRILSTRPADIIKDFKVSGVLLKAMVEKPAKALAYPMGTYNDAIVAYTKQAGFDMAFTLRSGGVAPGDSLYTLKRNSIYEWMDLSYFKRIVDKK
jgi:peptidoglycan/xylan/chitin deacetylase (PgdA/CDA1 family)